MMSRNCSTCRFEPEWVTCGGPVKLGWCRSTEGGDYMFDPFLWDIVKRRRPVRNLLDEYYCLTLRSELSASELEFIKFKIHSCVDWVLKEGSD